MTPPQWQLLMELVADVLECPPDTRAVFLAERCGEDLALKVEVLRLLKLEDVSGLDALPLEPEVFQEIVRADASTDTPSVQQPRDVAGEVASHASTHATRNLPSVPGYEILRELSHGGQGIVYQAIQRSTKRKVAVKILLHGPSASASARRHFEREVELVSHLRHPNIISVFDSGITADGRLFYVMEYVRGTSITQYVREKQLNLEETLGLFAGLCDAVNHAHQRAVIHRDLKPSNILVDSDGNLKVLDFGLAKAVTQTAETTETVTGQVLGTLPYMSPEQAKGNPDMIDTRTDVYALGVILYEVLTGAYPYPVVGVMADVLRHISETEPKPPTKSWTRDSGISTSNRTRTRGKCPIDDEVATITLRALVKDRGRRYQSAADLGADIRHYLANEPIQAKRDSGLYVLRKTVWRYRVPFAVAAAFVSLLAVATVVLSIALRQAAAAKSAVGTALDRANTEQKAAQTKAREALINLRLAEERLADGLVFAGDSRLRSGECSNARDSYFAALQLRRKLGAPDSGILFALLEGYIAGPPPLIGTDGVRGGVGGFAGHTGAVYALAFSPDGRSAISGASDNTLRLWDTRTGTEIRRFSGHLGGVHCVAFAPGGRSFISGSYDASMKLWDVSTGKELRSFSNDKNVVSCVAFSPDGRTALAGGRSLKLWDVSTGQEIRSFSNDKGSVFCVAFSPDGRTALAGGAGLNLWDVSTGKEIRCLPANACVRCVAFAPDGRTALSGGDDYTLRLWDTETWKQTTSLVGHTNSIMSVSIAPDGHIAISGGYDGMLKLWDLATGRLLRTFTGHTGSVLAVALSRDGRTALSGDDDHAIKLWDVRQGNDLPSIGVDAPANAVAISPDGYTAVSGSRDNLLLIFWDLATGMQLQSIVAPAPITAVAFSLDGRDLVSAHENGTLSLWDVESRREIRRLTVQGHVANGVALTPDSLGVVTACSNGQLTLWDVSTGKALRDFKGHNRPLFAVAISGDGQTLISGGDDNTLTIWAMATGHELRNLALGQSRGPGVLAISPDGRVAVGATGYADTPASLVDVATGKKLRRISADIGYSFIGQPIRIRTLAISPDRLSAVSVDMNGQMRLWDLSRPDRYAAFGEALTQAHEALNRTPIDSTGLSTLGAWYAFRGLDDWAAEFLEKSRQKGGEVSALTLARCYWRLRRFDDARIEFDKALRRNEAPESYLRLCTDAVTRTIISSYSDYAGRGEFEHAARACAKAIAIFPNDHWMHYQHACLLVQNGDIQGYRRECQTMLDLFGNTNDRSIADRVAKACLFAPVGGIDLPKACGFADRAVSGGKHNWMCYFQVAKGLAEYRTGRFEEATDWLTQSVAVTRHSPAVYCFVEGSLCLAMAQYRLGNSSDAKRWLKEGVDGLEQQAPMVGNSDFRAAFHDWIICQTLRKEAEGLVGVTATTRPAR